MRRRLGRGLLLTAALISVLVSCGGGQADEAEVGPTGDPVTYVALGGTESASGQDESLLVDAWTQQVFRQLPLRAVHVALARPRGVASQLDNQVDSALDLDATLATVWLGRTDQARGTPLAGFGSAVGQAVSRLRGAGVRVVVITDDSAGPYGDAAAEAADSAGGTWIDVGDLGPLDADDQTIIARQVGRKLTAAR